MKCINLGQVPLEGSKQQIVRRIQNITGMSEMKKLLLMDVDCGVDDAAAIMLALASPSVEILGITCCYGNSFLENTCANVLRVLNTCDKLKIPVYPGVGRPILGGPPVLEFYYGKDGLGDVPDPNAPGLDLLQKEHAVFAMIRLVSERPGQVSLVAIGPLTNLALAVKIDPEFHKKLKNVFIMGGNTEGKGNVTVCGEFNFATDPEAADIVLNEYTCPMYIVPLEFVLSHQLSWEFCHEWINQNTEKAKFMKKIYAFTLENAKLSQRNSGKKENESGFVSCDSYAVAAAVEEDFVTEVTEVGVSVELHGSLTRGMMVVDWEDRLKKKNKVFLLKKCDLQKLKELMMAALQ